MKPEPAVAPLMLLLAATLAGCAATQPPADDATARETVAGLERSKLDQLFGTTSERQEALGWYDGGRFLNVAPGPDGRVERTTWTELGAAVEGWPGYPPGTFHSSDVVLIPVTRGYVVSGLVSGPGPDGEPVTGWSTSVWSLEAGEWKTVFYQLTPR